MLSDLNIGQSGCVTDILIEDPSIRLNLLEMGLVSGSKVTILLITHNIIVVEIKNYKLALRKEYASNICVKT